MHYPVTRVNIYKSILYWYKESETSLVISEFGVGVGIINHLRMASHDRLDGRPIPYEYILSTFPELKKYKPDNINSTMGLWFKTKEERIEVLTNMV